MSILRVALAALLFPLTLVAEGHDLTPPLVRYQVLPVVTGNGHGFMAAWGEGWNHREWRTRRTTGPQLIGAFIAADGSLTNSHVFFGVPNDDLYWALDQHVVWNGQHFVVVFRRQRVIPCTSECPYAPRDPDQIRVMRLSAEGDPI